MARAYRSKLSYYTPTEEHIMEKSAGIRNVLYRPFVIACDKLRITPFVVSFLGFLAVVAAAIATFWSPITGLVLLLLYLFLDGLDGTLARYQKKTDVSGVFVDLIIDHVALLIMLVALVGLELSDPMLIYGYGVLYVLMMTFGIMMRALKVPLKGNVRTKSIVYALFAIWAISGINLFTLFFAITVPLMVCICLFRFVYLYELLRGQKW